MPEPRRLKKSETLEIRIPYPTKQAFMARCRDEGVSASEVLRGLIDGRLEERRPAPRPRTAWRLAVGVLIASAVGAVALPSLARPSALSELERLNAAGPVRDSQVRQAFERLDANGDGVISLDEFRRGGSAPRAR
jgi:hypothetical protein